MRATKGNKEKGEKRNQRSDCGRGANAGQAGVAVVVVAVVVVVVVVRGGRRKKMT